MFMLIYSQFSNESRWPALVVFPCPCSNSLR